MGNPKNKKVPKKRKASNNSQCKSSSDHKENVPKTVKTTKPDPDDCIAMSKQLLMKKANVRTQRRSSSKPERICPNGKPIPSLAELEKMYEDSDDDDQTLKTPTQKPICTTPTTEKPTSTSIGDENNLLSPSTINKITERLLGSIQKQNLPDPIELLEATSLIRATSSPLNPIIPPKKRKKPEVPYIVGCKDRPKVIRKPNANFCKGNDDYGVEASGDAEDETPAKRAKKSKIPNYTKSIFNAHSDEISERLTKDDTECLSDGSSDSNKTIEYNPTPFKTSRPHSFSPLPSTSSDKETFKKNDELFNESLKEFDISKESTPKKTDDVIINDKPVLAIKEYDINITEQSTPIKKIDNVLITKESTPNIEEDGVQIIDTPYDIIEIEDTIVEIQNTSTNAMVTDDIEIIEPLGSEVVKAKEQRDIIHEIPDDEDCIIVTSSDAKINHNNLDNLNEPIDIDEYVRYSINMEYLNDEPVEIIDVDDIIAENKSIIDKWKSYGDKEFNKINTVVDVTTATPSTAVQTTSTPTMPSTTLQGGLTFSTTLQAGVTPSTTLQAGVTPSTTLQAGVTPSTTLQVGVTPNTTLQAGVAPSTTVPTPSTPNLNIDIMGHSATNSQINQRQPTSVSNSQRSVTFQSILDHFFDSLRDTTTRATTAFDSDNGISYQQFCSMINRLPTPTRTPSHPANRPRPVSTNVFQNSISSLQLTEQTQRDLRGLSNSSSQQPPPSPVPTRNIGDCPICFDPLNSSDGIASTICGHVFCLNCIQVSVKTNGRKCPTCRKQLKGAGGGYHQIYL